MNIAIAGYTATSSAGTGMPALRRSLQSGTSGLRRNDLERCDLDTYIGRVAAVEEVALPEPLQHLVSRNNQLAWLALQQDEFLGTIERFKAELDPRRIGVVMGTSTSSIGRTEEAYAALGEDSHFRDEYRQPQVHNLHSPGLFVAAATGLQGPSLTISTACSSSAKVFATAARWLDFGMVDAVLVGGVDSLCLSILYGFNSLELISGDVCRPFDRRRDGINIGEAGGYALLTRPELAPTAASSLRGYGESSDAHHMSHPHPQGKGAVVAMDRALQRAGINAADIGYINLHGTASRANDSVETLALAQRFDGNTLASSTKGWTGHTLGAAGIVESIIAIDALQTGLIPGTLNCNEPDPEFPFAVLTVNATRDIRYSMNNSFGFGGSNASLVFGGLAT